MGHPVDIGHVYIERDYWLCLVGLDNCFGKLLIIENLLKK